MEWIVHFIVGTALPVIGGYVWGRYKDYREEKRAEQEEYALMKRGLQSVLRQLMLDSYHTHLSMGYATEDDKGSFEAMHQAYAGLGKNGVMDDIYQRYMALPALPEVPNVLQKNQQCVQPN